MKQYINHKILVTTNDWFYGPDGKQYRGVWGTLKGIHEAKESLGIIPSRAHANWFIEIGGMVIMGCRIMYLVKCPNPPPEADIKEWHADAANGYKEFTRPGSILIFNEPSDENPY